MYISHYIGSLCKKVPYIYIHFLLTPKYIFPIKIYWNLGVAPKEANFTEVCRQGRTIQMPLWTCVAGKAAISEFRTHQYHQNALNFQTNPMEPVPGSETQISWTKRV